MAALLFLLVALALGDRIRRRAVPDTRALFAAIAGRPADDGGSGPPLPPAWTFDAPAALLFGTLPLTWATYLAGYAFAALLPAEPHPLLPANVLVLALAAAAVALDLLLPRRRGVPAPGLRLPSPASLLARVRAYRVRVPSVYAVGLVVFFCIGWYLMASVFYVKDGLLVAGATVFSDYAPHMAVIRSFSHGRNFPTEYPMFAGEGIRYHFLFLFLTGNLEFLGMRVDLAFNLLGTLGLLSFCLLLGALAVLLVRRRSVFLAAPLLLFLRSSLAFLTYLGTIWKETDGSLGGVLMGLLVNRRFIGGTPYEYWGLWAVNVYSNQRHLLWGVAVLLVVLFLLLPLWRKDPQPRLLSRGAWLPDAFGPALWSAFLLAQLPYFHGSVLVAAFLVLGAVGLFSAGRLAFAVALVPAAASTLLQTAFFSGGASEVASPRILLGFVAEDKSVLGVLAYCVLAFGAAFVLLPLLPLLRGRRDAVLWLAFLLPFLFAFTVSLTPDVVVNHKFILLSFALENVFIAALLASLARPPRTASTARRAASRVLAVLLAVFLTATGAIDAWTFFVANRVNQQAIDLTSPVAAWIEANTAPDAVFLTPRYHYEAFFLAGRKSFLGWPYYSWSAGYDTGTRKDEAAWLYRGADGDAAAFRAFCRANGIGYAVVGGSDWDSLGYPLDEAFFTANCRLLATFPEQGNLRIYATTETP